MLPHIPEEQRTQTTVNLTWVTLTVQMSHCTQVKLHWVRWLVVLDITALDHQQNSDIRYDWHSPVHTVHGHDFILALRLHDATLLLLLHAAWVVDDIIVLSILYGTWKISIVLFKMQVFTELLLSLCWMFWLHLHVTRTLTIKQQLRFYCYLGVTYDYVGRL